VDFLLHNSVFHCGPRFICSKYEYLLIIPLRYINKCYTKNIFLIPESFVGYTFLNKMVTWGKCNFA